MNPSPPAKTAEQPPKPRRLWRTVVPALLLAPFIVLAAGYGALQLPALQTKILARLADGAGGPDLQISLSGVAGSFPFDITVERLTLGDREGPWATLQELELSWSVAAIWSPVIEVERLAIGTVAIQRTPKATATPATPDVTGDPTPRRLGLPVGLRLRQLSLPRIELAAGLFGQAMTLALSAQARTDQRGQLDARFDLRSFDSADRLAGKLRYDLPGDRLAVDLTADFPEASPLLARAELAALAPLTVALNGAGPITDWQADLSVRASQGFDLNATASLTSLSPLALTLVGDSSPAALLPADLRVLVAPALSFDLSLLFDDQARQAALPRIVLETALFRAEGQIALGLMDQRLTGALSLDIKQAEQLSSLTAPARFARARVNSRLGGTLSEPEVSVDGALSALDLTSLSIAELTFQAEAGLDRKTADQSLTFQLTSQASGLTGPDALTGLLTGPLTVTTRGRLRGRDPAPPGAAQSTTSLPEITRLDLTRLDQAQLDLSQLTVTSDRFTAQAQLTMDLARQWGAGQVRVSLPDIAPMAALVGQPAGGRLDGDLTLSLEGPDLLRISGLVTTRALTLADPRLAALLGQTPAIDLNLALRSFSDLTLESTRLQFTAGQLALGGTLNFDRQDLDLTATLQLPELARLQAAGLPLQGAATLTAALRGPFAGTQADWSLTSARLGSPLGDFDAVRAQGQVKQARNGVTTAMTLTATFANLPLNLTAQADLAGQTLTLPRFALTHGPGELQGQLAIDLDQRLTRGPLTRGLLTLKLPDLAAYQSLTGDALGGGLDATLDLGVTANRQQMAVRLDGRSLAYRPQTTGRQTGAQKSREPQALGAETLTLRGKFDDLLGRPSSQVTARITRLAAPGLTLPQLDLRLAGPADDLSFSGDGRGTLNDQPLTLDFSGRTALDDQPRVRLESLNVGLAARDLRLLGPAQLTIAPSQLRLDDLNIALDGGRLRAAFNQEEGRITLAAKLTDLPLSLVQILMPQVKLEGRINADLDLQGPLTNPTGRVDLQIPDFRSAAMAKGQSAQWRVQARLSQKSLTGSAGLSGLSAQPLDLAWTLPLAFDGSLFGVGLARQRPFQLSANWQGSAGRLLEVIGSDRVSLDGALAFKLAADGTLETPNLVGDLTLRDGSYENFLLGSKLQPVAFDLRLDGDQLRLTSFSVADGKGGTASLSGEVTRLFDSARRVSFVTEAKDFILVGRDDVFIKLNWQVRATGNQQAATLEGRVENNLTEIYLTADLPPSFAEIKVTDANAAPAAPTPADQPPGPTFQQQMLFDLTLDLPGRFFVRGRGLDSEWQGSFKLAGSAANPTLVGALTPVRGFFDFAGRRFELTDADLIFAGDKLVPEFSVLAVYRGNDDFRAWVRISGTSDAPTLTLSSEPALPQDEIVARVLFGKESARLSQAEAFQVASAIATLTSGGPGVIDAVRARLGVDVLNFAPARTENELGRLQAGKYVTDRVYIGVEQGAQSGSSSAVVQMDVGQGFKLESQFDPRVENNIGLRWEWAY